MKKKLLAVAIGLSMLFTNCFAAVGLDENNVKMEFKTVTAMGTTESGAVIAYSVTLKGDDRYDYTKVYSVGDVIANADGIFKIEFEFLKGLRQTCTLFMLGMRMGMLIL